MKVVLATVVALVAVPLITAAPAHAGSGKIVYGSGGHIYMVDDDGSGSPVDLTPGWSDFASDPSLSPDGSKVVFETNFFQNSGEIYVIPTAPTSPAAATRLTTNGVMDEYPVWSPDGTKIAFARDVPTADEPRNLEIFTMKSDGSGATRLTSDTQGAYDDAPSWSPDGTKIAWSTTSDDFGCLDGNTFIAIDQIHVMNAAGGGDVNVTGDPTLVAGNPDWSPDGTEIAFDGDKYTVNSDGSCAGSTGQQVYLMGSSGGGKSSIHAGYAPAWSPAGDRLVFNTSIGGPLAIMDASGGNVVPLEPSGTLADWGTTGAQLVATTTTLKVTSNKKLHATGDVSPDVSGESVSVTLYRKSGGKFQKVTSSTVVLDATSAYKTAFAHPKPGTCKVTTRYPGDATHLPSKKSVTSAC